MENQNLWFVFLLYQLLTQLAAWQLSTLKRSSKLVNLAFGCRICIFPPGPSWVWVGPCFFQTAKKFSRMFFFGSVMSSYVWLCCCRPLGVMAVAVVSKYADSTADSISKGFVSAFAIILTCFASFLFSIHNLPYTLACILISIHLYSFRLTSQAQSHEGGYREVGANSATTRRGFQRCVCDWSR